MFYRYLSALDKYLDVSVSSYHSIVDNQDIKGWQIQREIDRVAAQSPRPSTQTIIDDGKIIYKFFEWLEKKGYPGCVDFEYTTWQPNFKDDQLLAHIKKQALTTLDGRGVRALDKEVSQNKSYSLPANYEMKGLILGYSDPVYAAMFKLSLGTAMRPMDLCKFPYIGNGDNSHILPFESMHCKGETVGYQVIKSKSGKSRTIVIHSLDLKALDDHYIKKYYAPRAELYAKRYGKPCPPSILFLTSRGEPVTPKMISRRTVDARNRARRLDPSIRKSIRFYDARHWWPTIFLIQRFKKALLGQMSEVRDAAAMQVIKSQMGHAHLITTYNHYIDLARVVLLAHEGFVHELVTNPSKTIEHYLDSPTLL
jgi:integrase